MIKSLTTSSSPWITVNSYSNTPYINQSMLSSGQLRFNSALQRIEVYDGNTWLELGGYADVSLTGEAQNILNWAREAMYRERQLKDLMDQHPGIRDLKEKLDIMVALVTEQEKQKT